MASGYPPSVLGTVVRASRSSQRAVPGQVTARVLALTPRRRPYVLPALLAAGVRDRDVPDGERRGPRRSSDPDGVGGPPLFRLSAILSIFMLLDVLPRALWRAERASAARRLAPCVDVIRERWTGRRLGLRPRRAVLVLHHLRRLPELQGLPALPAARASTTPACWSSTARCSSATTRRRCCTTCSGTGFANSFLSFFYVIYLAFVPISLAAALVWFGDIRHGLWYATALCLNWVLGRGQLLHDPVDGPGVRRARAVRRPRSVRRPRRCSTRCGSSGSTCSTARRPGAAEDVAAVDRRVRVPARLRRR